MPYIDPTGETPGSSTFPQPSTNFILWVDEVPDAALPVPQIVSRFQGREAMWRTPHGDVSLFEAAEAIINSESTPATYRRAWADLQEFRRDSEMLLAIATALGLDAAAVDRLFILAGSIQA